MSANRQSSGKFKSKGTSILHTGPDKPDSMHGFLLEDDKRLSLMDNKNCANPQIHKNTLAQSNKSTKTHKSNEENNSSPFKNPRPEALERIHVQIRKELADKLIEMVYARKRERILKKKNATQRHIIEQALEEYFEKEGI